MGLCSLVDNCSLGTGAAGGSEEVEAVAPPWAPPVPCGPWLFLQQWHQRPHPQYQGQPLRAEPGLLQDQCHLRGWRPGQVRGGLTLMDGLSAHRLLPVAEALFQALALGVRWR